MNILENELVRKYFACENHGTYLHECIADRVLQSMQEPIKKGERMLCWNSATEIVEMIAEWDMEYHPINLRLPDRFQKQEKVFCSTRLVVGTYKCGACGEEIERQSRHVEDPKPSHPCEHNHGVMGVGHLIGCPEQNQEVIKKPSPEKCHICAPGGKRKMIIGTPKMFEELSGAALELFGKYADHQGNCSFFCTDCANRQFYFGLKKLLEEKER